MGTGTAAPAAARALTTDDVAVVLQRADLILTHDAGLMPGLIRRFTHSHWNHICLVYVLSDRASGSADGYQNTFILESQDRGVDIHPVDKYLGNEGKDIAVLRFPDAALPPARATDFKRRVRGFALDAIDAEYGYGTILTILEKSLGWLFVPLVRAAKLLLGRGRAKTINSYICSGVVEYAYYRACFGQQLSSGPMWDPFFDDAERVRALIVSPEARAGAGNIRDPALIELLKETVPAHFSRAAREGRLECIGERTGGAWHRELTKL